MGYTLLITEKPSAAKRIAHSLAEGRLDEKRRGKVVYYELSRGGKELVVAPAAGHLFVLDEKRKGAKWHYPAFSVDWRPTYIEKGSAWSKPYYDNLVALAKGAGELISACDYDIEGSVIAWNIIRFICNAKDGKRMKFSTLTTPDLVDAYGSISPHLDTPQIKAGLARHTLDWYFGVNLSRALTLSLEHVNGYWTLTTGRVQGPTLKLLAEREIEISKFVPKPYWEIELRGATNGKPVVAMHVEGKFWDKARADGVMKTCGGEEASVGSVKKSRQNYYPPPPFDLTDLQRESYGLFGYSPKMTLDIAQSLYEQALISYPRTSSQKLPPKIGYKKILTGLSGQPNYRELCEKLLARSTLKPNEGKKTDPAHPAIFPTGSKPSKLNPYQRKVYDLISRRFMATFSEPALRELVKVIIDVSGEKFAAHGTRILEKNWLEFYGPYAKFKDQLLPEVKEGDPVEVKKLGMLEKETQPPSRYSQASILKSMEDLHLGTKATRAHILHTLYERGYIKDRSIVVTELGKAVVKALDKYCPEILSPELTKRFEEGMESIQDGKTSDEKIIKDAEEELTKILVKFKENEKSIGEGMYEAVREHEKALHDVGKCPKCGGDLVIMHSKRTGKRFVGCKGYPKCSNSYPLPQHGFVSVISRKCFCGLNLIGVKSKGKRPWKFCVEHGFDYYKKKGKGAQAKKGEPKEGGAGEEPAEGSGGS